LWLVAVVGLAMLLAVRVKQEPLGRYDVQSRHLVWYSQLPQLLTVAGAAVLIVSAEMHRLRLLTVVAIATIAVAWEFELWLLPPLFAKVCANPRREHALWAIASRGLNRGHYDFREILVGVGRVGRRLCASRVWGACSATIK
jgi:predicted exporter